MTTQTQPSTDYRHWAFVAATVLLLVITCAVALRTIPAAQRPTLEPSGASSTHTTATP